MMVKNGDDGDRREPRGLEIYTPSYRTDFELCADLNRSVLRNTPSDSRHHLIVPKADIQLFRRLSGARTHVHDVAEFLPWWLVKVPGVNAWIDLRHPRIPVRGWIVQQIVKLAAAARSDAAVVVLVDSDILLVRPINAETFLVDDAVVLYKAPGAVHAGMPRHVYWHRVARELLGLPTGCTPPLPDYIGWPCAWDPQIVRRMLALMERGRSLPWQSAIAGQRHFSEMILYGVYVDEVLAEAEGFPTTTDMRCLNYSDNAPLDANAIESLVRSLRSTDFAVMVSAKSGTDLGVRRAGFRRLADIPAPVTPPPPGKPTQ